MVNDPSSSDTETLGQFLQRQRTEQGIELHDVAEETKIPPGTLRAMEGGDYDALPADAFARGFYSIYARFLGLVVEDILERYARERSFSPRNQKKAIQTPSRLGEIVSPMAERPQITPLSILGFVLVVMVLLITGICWYLSWNPATFLSEQLRSFGKGPALEQSKTGNAASGAPAASTEAPQGIPAGIAANGQVPGRQTAGGPAAGSGKPSPETPASKYTLQAEFPEPTKVTVNVDEEFPEEQTFVAGQTHSWYAKGSIVLALPPTTKTRLTLNGVVIPLPEPVDGFITVSIPGSQTR